MKHSKNFLKQPNTLENRVVNPYGNIEILLKHSWNIIETFKAPFKLKLLENPLKHP